MYEETYLIRGETLEDIADAIREKKQSQDVIVVSDFASEIVNLPSGGGETIKPTRFSYNGSNETVLDFTDTSLDTSLILSAEYMFGNCPNLTTLNIADLDFSSVTNAGYIFSNDANLRTVTLGNLNLPSLTSCESMFRNVGGVTSLNITSFNIPSNITNFRWMFNTCQSPVVIQKILSLMTASNATNMSGMFYQCSQLTSLDMSSITATPTNVSQMFQSCTQLTHLDIRNITFSGITTSSSYQNMFGANYSTYVPANCEIIVKDDTEKTWFATYFSRMTNVKTVAEYEAEQSE